MTVIRSLPTTLVSLCLLSGGCDGGVQEGRLPGERSEQDLSRFIERAADSDLDFVHFNGMSGEFYYSEMMGSGAALTDYDNDGDLDVYLVQGHMLPPTGELNKAVFQPGPGMVPLQDRLYRNDLHADSAGKPVIVFTDVTQRSGIRGAGYGMGVATGDINNDGSVDLYVTNKGPNQMWLNNGDGTFRDVTADSATGDAAWGTSAVFFDLDRDGWLDLYVGNYVDFTLESHKLCRWLSGAPDYCGPLAYQPQKDRLFRNLGDGRFEDLSGRANILSEAGAGLGVVTGDWNADGWPDLYVANDGMPNFLWINQGDRTFHDEALITGSALNLEGQAEAGMGVAAGDFDADGDEDLLLTHLALETNTLYRNEGNRSFEDVSLPSGVGVPSLPYTGFGTAWIDYDNDGWLDILAVNGAVKIIPHLVAVDDPYPLHMPNQLLRNLGAGRFEQVKGGTEEGFGRSEVSRGVAIGDVDNDGDLDAVIANNSGPVRLLINQSGESGSWLGLRLVNSLGHRDALGAWVEVSRSAPPALGRRVRTEGSYLSAHDPRLAIGLGDTRPGNESVRIIWPSGDRAVISAQANRYTTVQQGAGDSRRRD